MANTLAYYKVAKNKSVEGFIAQGPEVNSIKPLGSKFSHSVCKLDRFLSH